MHPETTRPDGDLSSATTSTPVVSLSALVAGLVTVLVGFTSSVVIVLEAARALGATPAQSASWIWALGVGMGLTSMALSWFHKVPVVTAWSTSGAALVLAAASSTTLAEATGAFLISAVLITFSGFSGVFERLLQRIPLALAAALLAGILLRFGLDAFRSFQTQPILLLLMLLSFLAGRRWWPRYAVVLTLVTGVAAAWVLGLLGEQSPVVPLALTTPVWVTPSFSLTAMIGVALPLFLVTMASQNVPGVAAIRASGYQVPISPVIGWTGVTTLLLAPFGGFALNLAAITAAICLSPEAHPDPSRRYVAGMAAGFFYLLTGLAGATVVALFAALPRELVLGIAGLALLGTIGSALKTALDDADQRDAALLTFLVSASGLTLFGIGPAFWGLLAGVLALLVLRPLKR